MALQVYARVWRITSLQIPIRRPSEKHDQAYTEYMRVFLGWGHLFLAVAAPI
jgi:hypothetical protein